MNKNSLVAVLLSLSLGLGAASPVRAADEAAKAMETFQAQEKVRVAEEAKKKQEEDRKAAQAAANSQKAAQEAAKKKSQQTSKMAQMLGMGLTVAGLGMIMASMATSDPATKEKLKETGTFTMMGGMAASMVGGMLGQNADKANSNASNMDSMLPTVDNGSLGGNNFNTNPDLVKNSSGDKNVPLGDGVTTDSFVAIDPKSKAAFDKIMDNFEKQTGVTRDQFASALASGAPLGDIMNGRGGLTKDMINEALAKGQAAMGSGTSGASLAKLADEVGLGELANQTIDAGVDFSGGGKALASNSSSGASSLPPLDLAGMMPPAPGANSGASAAENSFNFERDVNPAIKRELAAKGIVQDSLFELVAKRYRVLAPMMLGYGPSIDPKTKTN